MPRVSVNICCYNGERYIAGTLRSVLAQTYSDLEIVVLDDGSTDGTGSVVRSFSDPRINYHRQANAGLSASRNRAIELSSGEFIAILDQDDLWMPDKLELQVALMDASPDVGVVYSDANVIDEEGNIIGRGLSGRYARGKVLLSLLKGNFIYCPTVMFRASALKKAGKFRTDLRISEEYEMFLRLARICEFDLVEKPLAAYRVHSSNTSRDVSRDYSEILVCLEGFSASEPDAGLRSIAERSACLFRVKLACVHLLAGRAAQARAVLAGVSAVSATGILKLPLYLLSLFPAPVYKTALFPVRKLGLMG